MALLFAIAAGGEMPQQLSALLGVLHLFTRGGMISFLCHHMFLFLANVLSFPQLFLFRYVFDLWSV